MWSNPPCKIIHFVQSHKSAAVISAKHTNRAFCIRGAKASYFLRVLKRIRQENNLQLYKGAKKNLRMRQAPSFFPHSEISTGYTNK